MNYWYNKEDIEGFRLLINEGQTPTVDNFQAFQIDEPFLNGIRSVLENDTYEGGSRCVTYFRDAFVIDGKVINLCLSCGDIIIDGVRHYLSSSGEVKLLDIKENLKK